MAYERRVKTVSSALAEIGGLYYGILATIMMLNELFGRPLRILDLGVSFRQLQMMEGPELFSKESREDLKKYTSRMGLKFYIQYWMYKRIPWIFRCCYDLRSHQKQDGKRRYEDPNLLDTLTYYDRLHSTFLWHMSIKRECV